MFKAILALFLLTSLMGCGKKDREETRDLEEEQYFVWGEKSPETDSGLEN